MIRVFVPSPNGGLHQTLGAGVAYHRRETYVNKLAGTYIPNVAQGHFITISRYGGSQISRNRMEQLVGSASISWIDWISERWLDGLSSPSGWLSGQHQVVLMGQCTSRRGLPQ